MPWLPVDTIQAHDSPPFALRGDLACNPDNAGDFYVDRGRGADYETARNTCRRCPAIAECLEWALDTKQRFGMWGAATPAERTQMLRDPRLRATVLDQVAQLAAANAAQE